MRLLNKLVLLLVFFASASLHSTQAIGEDNTDRTVSEQQWQTLTNDTAFNYKKEKEITINIPNKAREPNAFERLLNRIFEFFTTTVGQFIFWGFIILVLAYAAYKMLANDRFFLFKKGRKPIQHDVQSIEEDISLANWEDRMQQAIKANDMRHAVRYSYMWLLQLLQNKELIQYRNDKTNYDYYSELIDTPYKQSFKQLSRQYEYAWYGHFNIPESAYNDYMQLFNNVKKQLL